MILTDIMKYIESEYNIINSTPCEICGGGYEADQLEILLIDNVPFDVCECSCSDCGHEKTFEFYAPFLNEKNFKDNKILN